MQAVELAMQTSADDCKGPTPMQHKTQAHKDHAPLLVAKSDLSGDLQQQINNLLESSVDETDPDILKAQAKVLPSIFANIN